MALTREQAQQKVKEILDLARNEKKTISYQEVMNKLSELDIDADAIDAVFETLEAEGVSIVSSSEDEAIAAAQETVEPEPAENKGYGNSTTIAFDVTDAKTAKLVLLSLAETVAARLRQHKKKAELVSVSIKNSDLRTVSHQAALPVPSDITYEIYREACRLFDELWDGSPIRHLGIHTGKLGEGKARQLDIFDRTDYEKLARLDAALDSIRNRHGQDAVMRAAFLKSPVDHMSGGISREKRTVDYTKEKVE